MAVALLAGKPKQIGKSTVGAVVTTRQTALLLVINAEGETEQRLVQVGTGFPVNGRTWILTEVVRVGKADDAALKGKALVRIENAGF